MKRDLISLEVLSVYPIAVSLLTIDSELVRNRPWPERIIRDNGSRDGIRIEHIQLPIGVNSLDICMCSRSSFYF